MTFFTNKFHINMNTPSRNIVFTKFKNITYQTKLFFGMDQICVLYIMHRFLEINMECFLIPSRDFKGSMLEQLRQIKGREIFVNTINDYIAIHFSYELSQVARNENKL